MISIGDGGDVLMTSRVPGCLPAGRHFAYSHIFVAVSVKAREMLEWTVARELKEVSRYMAWA